MRNQTIKLRNIQLSSFLTASGLQLVSTTREGNEVYFEFSPKKQAQDLIADYFSDRATVNPRELFSRFNDLKDLIFSGGKE